ncbi:MAG: hypothetical protein J6Q53_00800 [Oscillospiraceae bacterium]|nr:hypothetical protein [Oscillospiraceae bacterium]
MGAIREYLISVVSVAAMCGILNSFMKGKGTVTAVIKFLSGVCLALAIASPLVNIKLSGLLSYTDILNIEAENVVTDGENKAQQAISAIIKSETEAYILDKAASLGIELEVESVLSKSQPQIPEKIILTGSVSPYAKAQLSAWIRDKLGISEEEQQWNG